MAADQCAQNVGVWFQLRGLKGGARARHATDRKWVVAAAPMVRTSGLLAFIAGLLLSEGLYFLAPLFNAKIRAENSKPHPEIFHFARCAGFT